MLFFLLSLVTFGFGEAPLPVRMNPLLDIWRQIRSCGEYKWFFSYRKTEAKKYIVRPIWLSVRWKLRQFFYPFVFSVISWSHKILIFHILEFVITIIVEQETLVSLWLVNIHLYRKWNNIPSLIKLHRLHIITNFSVTCWYQRNKTN
jgi:hypothetical protein